MNDRFRISTLWAQRFREQKLALSALLRLAGLPAGFFQQEKIYATTAEPWIVPIPGTTKLHRLDENIGAVAVELTPNDLREIDGAASKLTVQGARYPEKREQMTGR